jgi:hypothetical protein
MQRCVVGRARREKTYRDRAMVAEREANLAIVVVFGRRNRRGWRRQNGNGQSGLRAQRNCVMMPAEEDRLDQDRESGRERGNPGPSSSSPTDQRHDRAAPRISILRAPRSVHRIRRPIDIL